MFWDMEQMFNNLQHDWHEISRKWYGKVIEG